MPGFSYVAVDQTGRETKGSMDAENRERAAEQIRKSGLVPLSIKEQGVLNKEIDFSLGRKVKPRDLSVFCRQFVSITQAGVPMKEALQMLAEQTENKWLKRAIFDVLTNVEKGNTLADSMMAYQDIFPGIMVSMVRAGESSGNLEMAFSRMAVHFEKQAKLKATIRKATIYPIILICAAIGVVAVMLLFVIPIFIDMFADLDVEMPALTMAVMNTSEWTASHWYVILIVIVAVVAAYHAFYRTDDGRRIIDEIKMHMPLFGKLTVKSACAEFARTMSTLLAAGLSTVSCLDIVSGIIKNIHYVNALQKAKEEIMKGIPLSEPLQSSGIFPPMVYHMTGIGEETGNIEDMLSKLADYYDEEVEITTQSILAAMEPLIIVFMAVIVGTLVIAVILPIGAMYEGLDKL
ncbi:type II secretion system F family protein [Oscillospiraceae bacterium NTUH-002-81]|nr:type II secretion system F family protein [Oscillospiraceae bacterium NTUH-002-81]